MANKGLLLKLAKILMKFATVETDKGILNYEGELVEGIEVFIEDENGDMQPAADGEYIVEKQKITVKDGKIEKIEEIVEEETAPAEEQTMEEETTVVVEPETPAQEDALVMLANEIEMIKAEIENIKAEIKGIKEGATEVSVEDNYSKAHWDRM